MDQTLSLYPTALTVLNRAATQVTQQPVADPYAETNPDWVLLCDLLNSAGRDICNAPEEPWTHLIKETTFTTAGATAIALPSDFRAMVDNTLWNRSNRLPGIGPLSSQQRAALKARLVSIVLNITFRIEGNVMSFPITPPTGQTIGYEYYSTYWVQSSGSVTGPDKGKPTASTDVLLFDEELLIAALVLRFLENRGYDTQKAEQRYTALLEDAIGRNAAASVISLGGNPRNVWDRMIGASNVKEGGW